MHCCSHRPQPVQVAASTVGVNWPPSGVRPATMRIACQAQLADHRVAHQELLRLAGHRDRQLLHEADVARHLVVRDLVAAEGADLVLGAGLCRLGDDPGAQLLAVARSGTPKTCTSCHLGVAEQELLDLARVDVLAAADHHVLHAADDVAVALGVQRGQVAGVHPAVAHRLGGALGVAPVALHHANSRACTARPSRPRARCGPRRRRS
jgi:hypothetical protein